MKRFLMFLVILIAVVSLGLTIYYFSVDNEVIYIKSSYLVVNTGNTFRAEGENGLLDFRNKSDYTTLTYSSQDEEVLSYNDEGYFRAEKGGETQIIVNTNNRSYSRLVIDVLVCDGSAEYPYMVRNEEELKQMDGNLSYKLNGDIELTNNWVPKSFNGVLDGNHYTIKGLKITDDEISSGADVGFISVLGGVIKNLNLQDININVSKASTIGAFAGKVNGGTITDSDGNLVRQNGLIQTSEATGTITNTNTTSGSIVGGVAGSINNDSKIDRCGFDGTLNITGSSIRAGGIVGVNNNSVISESYAREKVNNGSYNNTTFGGIVGENNGSKPKANVYDCYFYAKDEPTRNGATEISGIVYRKSGDALVTGCYYGGKMGEIGGSTPERQGGLIHEGDLKSSTNYYLTDTISGFQNINSFVTTESSDQSSSNRNWNFSSVWSMGQQYPILNVESSVGSVYNDIDDTKINTTDRINSATTLYNTVKANDKQCVVSGTLNMNGYVWKVITSFDDGSTEFSQTIIGENNAKVTNFIIDASDVAEKGDVGLVGIMGANAVVKDITFENVRVTTDNGRTYKNVGVLAGKSNGAKVNNVSINGVDVNVSGYTTSTGASYYGTFFGFAQNGTVISRAEVYDIDVTDGYYTVAGGFVGAGYPTITADGESGSTRIYNYANKVKLVSNYAGGIVGANGGTINYTTTNDIQYSNRNESSASNYTKQIYTSTTKKCFVGGIVGANDCQINGNKVKGTISNVYANDFKVNASTTIGYKMYYGGIAGANSSDISKAYVKSANIVLDGSHNAFVGGITGYNSGRILNSVVDADSRISTNIVASVGTSVNGNNYMLNTDNCTIVGGIAGYDTNSTNSSYSIYQSATYAKEIKGYYAGGISGISFGKVGFSYCGESTKDNGGVTISGYMVGGLSSVVAGGFMKNCYTFCRLNTTNGGSFQNIMSVVRMEVSAAGGLTVFALNGGTVVESCYCVVSFGGSGVSYGSSADLTGTVCGTIKNCAYQTASRATNNGKKLTQSEFKGSPNYNAFKNAVGGDISYWDFPTNGGYPTIAGVNVNFPSSNLPTFH